MITAIQIMTEFNQSYFQAVAIIEEQLGWVKVGYTDNGLILYAKENKNDKSTS